MRESYQINIIRQGRDLYVNPKLIEVGIKKDFFFFFVFFWTSTHDQCPSCAAREQKVFVIQWGFNQIYKHALQKKATEA